MIHIGKYYLVDPDGCLYLKPYQPCVVKVLARYGFRRYVCLPVEPVVFPCREDGYMTREIVIDKKYLKPYDAVKREEVVIRIPTNLPAVSESDVNFLKSIANTTEDRIIASRLRIIITKLTMYASINKERHNG